MERIQLGDRVRDKITGFEGVAVARTEWQYGCIRFTLQSTKLHDGTTIDPVTFDEPQLEIVKPRKEKKSAEESGGPRPEPVRAKTPSRF